MTDAHAPGFTLDKRQLRAAFGRAASSYDAAAVLQREVSDRLIERLEFMRLAPARVLDAGCGTGYACVALARRYPRATLLGVDIAEAMVVRARARLAGTVAARLRRWLPFGAAHRQFVTGDIEALPLADASVDLVVSSLALQWCDARAALREMRRVLRPGGLLMFATTGAGSLAEMRAAWRAADDDPHVHGFLDMHDLGDLLIQTGFADPVLDVDRLTLTYKDVHSVLRDLKAIGARNAAAGRARALTGKARFRRFQDAYEELRVGGVIPATYEIVYGHAWIPNTPPPAADGVAVVSLSRLRRR